MPIPKVWFLLTCIIWSVESAVLDPSLYLSPSPPLTPANNDVPPETLWSQSLASRHQRDTGDLVNVPTETIEQTNTEKESLNTAETFWPSFRTTGYSLRGIHIPLTFSISGSYGNHGGYEPGIIGSSYGSLTSDDSASGFGSYGKSALAGSSYSAFSSGYPGVRIFGNSGRTGWSGWGNGKWGHYGKG